MKNIKATILLLLFVPILLFVQCKDAKQESKRYISDADTAYSEDIRSISKRINKNPGDANLYATRANAFYFEDKFEESVKDIEYALELNPEEALYHFKRGFYLMSMDTVDYKVVRDCYKKALELQPNFPEAGIELAKLQIARMEYQNAETYLSDILYLDKTYAPAYFYRGISKKEQGDTVTAVDMFTQALVHKDDYWEANMELGLLYAEKGDPIALQYFDKVLEFNELSTAAMYAKGLFMQKKGQYKDALKLYERVVSLNPGHRLAFYNMAFIYLRFEEYGKAKEKATSAIDLDPSYDNAIYLKGLACELSGSIEEAKELYAKCLEVNPEHSSALRDLEKLKAN